MKSPFRWITHAMLVLAPFSALFAQVAGFTKTLSGPGIEEGRSVQQTPDGGFAVAGQRDSSAELVKFDAAGDTLWTRRFTFPFGCTGNEVRQTTDSGFIIAGRIADAAGESYVSLIRTNAHGDTVWTRCFCGNPSGSGNTIQQSSVLQSPDGGFIVCGSTENSVFLVKTDTAGALQWSRTFGGSNSEFGYSVCPAGSGYMIAGETRSTEPPARHAYLVRTDAGGNRLWEKKYGGEGSAIALCVRQTADDGFIVAGSTAVSDSALNENGDVFVLRLNSSGDTVWTRTYGGPSIDAGVSVRQTPDSGYVVVGTTESFGHGASDIYLLRLSPDGDTIWTRTFGGPGFDTGRDICLTSGGGYALTGSFYDPGLGFELVLIKTNPDGMLTGMEEPSAAPLPSTMTLDQNYPNPFNPSTTIGFSVSRRGVATLRVYDALGRTVASLVKKELNPGHYAVQFNAGGLASGIYYYRLELDGSTGPVGNTHIVRSMVILK